MRVQNRPKHGLLFLTLSLTYITVGVVGTLPGASLLRLAQNTHVSLTVIGEIFVPSALGYMIGALIAGQLTRKINSRFLLAIGLGLLGSGSLIVALTSSFSTLIGGQLIRGLGFGFIDISLNMLASLAFGEVLSEKLNTIHGMYGLGALIGPTLLALCLELTHNFYLAFYLGSALALFTLLLALPQRTPMPKSFSASKQQLSQRSATWKVITSGMLWLLMAQTCLYSAAELGFGSWIVTVVSKSAGLTLVMAAPVATAYYAGMMLGRMSGAQILRHGWLSQSRLLYLALIMGGLTGLLVAIAPGQLLIVYPASVLIGFWFGPVYPCLMATMSRRFTGQVGTASSMMMIGSGMGTMFIPVMMGALIPILGFNGVIAFPAIFCLLVIPPMWAFQREKRQTLPLPAIRHIMDDSAEMPVYQ